MNTRKIAKPFFKDFLFEKEEVWLNEMAAQGWNMIKPGFRRATFEQGAPGEWIYRIQVLPQHVRRPESKEYFEFMRTTGVELVRAADQLAYFRKRSAEGTFELFTDRESLLAYARNLRKWWVAQSTLIAVISVTPVMNLLPAGQLTEKPMLDWAFLILWVSIIGATVIVSLSRLRQIDRRVRELESQPSLTA